MLVIVSNRRDRVAEALAAQWSASGYVAGLLTPRDLATSGWRHYVDGKGPASSVIQRSVIKTERIIGVVTRMPSVFDNDLPEIVPEDRTYVAAEMTAMLLSWLLALRCPVINRPTATCLAGPYWSTERWLMAARDLQIPTLPFRRSIRIGKPPWTTPPAAGGVSLTVIGKRVFGDASPELASRALKLAELADCDLLAATFDHPGPDAHFVGAHLCPDVSEPILAEALVAYILNAARTIPA
jgi:hypothetical protein